jgi:hypothetical protein
MALLYEANEKQAQLILEQPMHRVAGGGFLGEIVLLHACN